MKILQFPLSKITLGFILGILICPLTVQSLSIIFGILFLFIILLIGIQQIKSKTIFQKNCFGVVTFLASVSLGISIQAIHKQTYNKDHYIHYIQNQEINYQTEVEVTEKLKNTVKNARYIVKINTLNNNKSFGKAILNISLSDTVNFKIGSLLSLDGKFYQNKLPFNPNQFDYGKYLERQEIYAQIYTRKSNIKIIGNESTVWSFFSNYREKLIGIFEKSNLSKRELSVFIALLLGQQQDVAPDVLKDYQYSGAVHILSVSGLHVGFIMMFINLILRPIPNSRKGSLSKLIVIILGLWSFAILAGLSPSVVRSVTMFSFLAIGNSLRRDVNIYNSLLVSMFVILCFNPAFLYDVGFQLSYLALFFIIWMQPLFDKLWEPENRIVKYFWGIITMSSSAQLGAMPLSIYYFHQFPGLFFVTNLLVLPILGIVMALGVIALGFAAFGFVPFYVVKPLEWSIRIVNDLIHWVASFDDFVIKNISFSETMLWASYFLIITWVIWFQKSTFNRLAFALISIITFQSVFILQKYDTLKTKEAIIFSSRKNTIITERFGNKVTLYSHDSILKTADENLTIQSYLTGNFSTLNSREKLQNLLFIKGKKVVVIDSSAIYLENIKPDVLLLVNSPKLNMERVLQFYKPKVVIADGSNYKSYSKFWEATCQKEKIPFHNTHEKGFYKF